jgi:hypothetical protein
MRRRPHHPSAEPDQASLPLRANPAKGALVGTVVLFALLALPGSVILLVAAFVISVVRDRVARRRSGRRVGPATFPGSR